MAFNMKRPVIKGTPFHKASIAKAKSTSIVAAAEQGADAALIDAGINLGLSRVGEAIDFSTKSDKPSKESQKLDFKRDKRIKNKKEKKKKEVRDKTEVTPIEPRGYVQPKKKKEQLKRTTQEAPDGGKSTDRFADAAEEFGYDISTPEGWKEAEATMEYDDKLDKWINPRVTSDIAEVTIDPDLAEIQAEELRKINEAKELKEQQKKDAKIKSDKIKEHNKGVRERNEIKNEQRKQNKLKAEARDHYGSLLEDGKLTQAQFDAYNEMIRKQAEAPEVEFLDIEEEDDPDVYQQSTTSTSTAEPIAEPVAESTSKPKQSDFRDKKNPFGGLVTARDQQKKALKAWYAAGNTDSPLDKRDDRIWNGAIKGGKVHENMRKSGYMPHSER